MPQTTTSRRIRLGIIVPSSNTALEPISQEIVSDVSTANEQITVHFARFRVTKIDMSIESDKQFSLAPMLEAASYLADARVDMIGWSGTSAAWLGFETDENLCYKITAVTGVPATTSIIAMREKINSSGATNIGVLTPYSSDVNAAIIETFASAGLDASESRSQCSKLSTNYDFAGVTEVDLDCMVANLSASGTETVLVICTNLHAARMAKTWEDTYGVIVFDSVATVIRGMLSRLEVDMSPLGKKWGSVFKK
ncbi:hypothetical protein KC335_g4680 [Hortaea werneckii]|uniref:Asp/Glu/hydantoin racemase n=1 Tax=Hortaea werneckii TaxID=91943 RepID=A0A3M7ISG5_HORWE|nr:hypothetical protein KC329_g9265 [Hortaea werneckii]KAI7271771.1 hypothetical protein KC335_g4680 [Hortaea werneckii]KAI7443507.1 hypothetical protein KC368_g8903 [Hortaea werneckii]RMZ28292.1 hypothetical protein D0859_07650 [Hortaea werneckii]